MIFSSLEREFQSLFFSLDIETLGLFFRRKYPNKNSLVKRCYEYIERTKIRKRRNSTRFYVSDVYACQKVRRCPFLSRLRSENEVVGNELKLSCKDILSQACFIAATLPAPEYFVKIFVAE